MGDQEAIELQLGPSEVLQTLATIVPDYSHQPGPCEVKQTPVEAATR